MGGHSISTEQTKKATSSKRKSKSSKKSMKETAKSPKKIKSTINPAYVEFSGRLTPRLSKRTATIENSSARKGTASKTQNEKKTSQYFSFHEKIAKTRKPLPASVPPLSTRSTQSTSQNLPAGPSDEEHPYADYDISLPEKVQTAIMPHKVGKPNKGIESVPLTLPQKLENAFGSADFNLPAHENHAKSMLSKAS